MLRDCLHFNLFLANVDEEMEQIFNLIDNLHSNNSRIKLCISESTMMQIVHSAMNKAYRKIKLKNGVLERLNQTSKFYELAVMLLEGCLKFVQEETDNFESESGHEVLLEDLTVIRDRLQRRLKEIDLAISEKDRELSERLSNELNLRKFFLSSQVSIENGDRDDELCELKNSVDQKVWNIQQQLGPNYEMKDEDRCHGIGNKKIEQMGSDISSLKETLDLSFCKMQNAIFLSELGPIEDQWMWNIERGISAIVIKGSLNDFRENLEGVDERSEMQVSFDLRKDLSDDQMDIEQSGIENMDKVWEKVMKSSVSDAENEEVYSDMRTLKQEIEDSYIKIECDRSVEEKYDNDLGNATMNLDSAQNSIAAYYQNSDAECNSAENQNFSSLDDLELMLKDDVYAFLLQEILREWNENTRDIISIANYALVKLQERNVYQSFEYAAMSIKDDVCKIHLTEMIKEWKMKIDPFSLENLIKDDVLQLAIIEATKDACISEQVVWSVSDQMNEIEHFQELLDDEQSSSDSENIKLEKHLGQSDVGKEIVGNSEWSRREMTPVSATAYCREPPGYQANDIEEMKMNIYEFLLVPNIEMLSRTLDGLMCSSCTTLEGLVSRLDAMKNQLDSLAELTVTLRQKESLYRKAFIRRCQHLQMAETEVDLLGDQVDMLLGLLDKIYITLHRHSPVLQQHSEVSEMLKLVEREIGARK